MLSLAGLRTMDLSRSLRKRSTLIRDLALGIPESRFWDLFVQCSLCKTVVLREPFSAFHECSSRQQTQPNILTFTHVFPDEDGSTHGGDTDIIEESDGEAPDLDDDFSEPTDTELPTALDFLT